MDRRLGLNPSPPSAARAPAQAGAQLATGFVIAGMDYLVQLGTEPLTAPAVMAAQLCFVGPDQEDADDEGIPGCLDPCTDSDRDGYGDGPLENRPFETCPQDNCEEIHNAGQEDSDGDGIGDPGDEDEVRCHRSRPEAAANGSVRLAGKGCYIDDCISITVEGPACLELDRGTPSDGRIFDVTDHVADAVGNLIAAGLDPVHLPQASVCAALGGLAALRRRRGRSRAPAGAAC